ncbi:MAG: hypothetical protein Q8M09_18075, partial [Pseudomonadota bacterium]|nr:hypothetical protein [Pseudomonadota bacterium]
MFKLFMDRPFARRLREAATTNAVITGFAAQSTQVKKSVHLNDLFSIFGTNSLTNTKQHRSAVSFLIPTS